MKPEVVLSHLYHAAYKHNQPVSVVIELLTKCNLNCRHCYLPERISLGIELIKVKGLLTELRALGVINVLFTGGEVLLREDLIEIIAFARSLYLRVTVLSNGTLLDENIVEKIAKLHITEFSTTMFSLDNQIHDDITQIKGSLNKLLNNLELLRKYNINVKVKMPILRANAKCIEDIQRYCIENSFDFFTSLNIFKKNDGDNYPQTLCVKKDMLHQVVKKMDQLNDYNGSRVHQKAVPCAALFYSFAVDSQGDVYPCNSLLYKVGNIYKSSIKEIWNDSKQLKTIKAIKNHDLYECSSCDYKLHCERCPGMALLDSRDIYACDTQAKSIAKVRLISNHKCEEIKCSK